MRTRHTASGLWGSGRCRTRSRARLRRRRSRTIGRVWSDSAGEEVAAHPDGREKMQGPWVWHKILIEAQARLWEASSVLRSCDGLIREVSTASSLNMDALWPTTRPVAYRCCHRSLPDPSNRALETDSAGSTSCQPRAMSEWSDCRRASDEADLCWCRRTCSAQSCQ